MPLEKLCLSDVGEKFNPCAPPRSRGRSRRNFSPNPTPLPYPASVKKIPTFDFLEKYNALNLEKHKIERFVRENSKEETKKISDELENFDIIGFIASG